MPFDITTFRSAMTYDGQRPNLFEVEITPNTDWANFSDMNLFCKGTSIPGATIGTVIVPYFGREVKLAGNRTFPEWTVTVLNDENWSIRSQFESWMNAINSHGANIRTTAEADPNDYTKSAVVTQYAKKGGETGKYKFANLFPTDLSEITLDWGDNDTVEEYTVTFAYDYWTTTPSTKSAGKGKTRSQGITVG